MIFKLSIAIIAISIILEGFFSGSEIAIISLNRIRLKILAETKEKKASQIYNMLKNPNRLLGTTLVGTNIAVVIASSFCAKLIYDYYGLSSQWLTTLILSPVVLIFGEFIPKTIFAQSADKITFYLASVLQFFWRMLYPIVWLIGKFVDAILRLLTGSSFHKKRSPFVTKEEIRYLIKESETEGQIDPYERSIIYKIFDFSKKKVKDVMWDMDKLVYLSESTTIEGLLTKAKESNYSRFPIRSQDGEFKGLVHILDVIYEENKAKKLKDFLRPIETVEEEMDIDNAFFLLKSKKQSLAIAVDKDGKPTGFFALEDLLEELVGEID
jgi:CBS domain containing-hemolysin-like protein